MLSFKQFLESHEIDERAPYQRSEMFIRSWLEEHLGSFEMEKITIRPNGDVDVSTSVSISSSSVKEIPIKFNVVRGSFECDDNGLTTLKGCPKIVTKDFNAGANPIRKLDGVPQTVGGDMTLSYTEIESLVDVHRFIREIDGKLYINGAQNFLKKGGLGLLMIAKLQGIMARGFEPLEIINKHLQDECDIFACQQELIDKGYGDYAQL